MLRALAVGIVTLMLASPAAAHPTGATFQVEGSVESFYVEAMKAYREAERLPEGPARRSAFRKAGFLYKAGFEKRPDRDPAPEAAMFGAKAFREAGDYQPAMELLDAFVHSYGSDAILSGLVKGDPKSTPPTLPDPKQYARRVEYVQTAFLQLAMAQVVFFEYAAAAKTYGEMAANRHLSVSTRRDAARNALILRSHLGAPATEIESLRSVFMTLTPSPEQKVEVDYLTARVADDPVKRLGAFVKAHDKIKDASTLRLVIEASHQAAALRREAGDPEGAAKWCRETTEAFERLSTTVPEVSKTEPRLRDMAAECAYRALDAEISRSFAPAHYKGRTPEIERSFDADIKAARSWTDKLLTATHESPRWSAAARARAAGLFDACRTALYTMPLSNIRLLTDAEQRRARTFRETPPDSDIAAELDETRQKRREEWRSAQHRMLENADAPMVRLYVEAILLGRALGADDQLLRRSARRLAALTPIVTNARINAYLAGLNDPKTRSPFVYRDDLFVTAAPSAPFEPPSGELPVPLPAGL